MKRYNFEKTLPFRNEVSAEMIAVHAHSDFIAHSKAHKLLEDGERLIGLRDNRPCYNGCKYCEPRAAQEEG